MSSGCISLNVSGIFKTTILSEHIKGAGSLQIYRRIVSETGINDVLDIIFKIYNVPKGGIQIIADIVGQYNFAVLSKVNCIAVHVYFLGCLVKSTTANFIVTCNA